MGFLRERSVHAVEKMDFPDCDQDRLERTYAQFAVVNKAVSGWRHIYRKRLRPLLTHGMTRGVTATLLDIGCGGGDISVQIARWAAKDGLPLSITAIDPDERAHRFALGRPAVSGLTFRQSLSSELVAEGKSFDFVISNHVLHHLSPAELLDFLSDSEALCTRAALHSDLRRSPAGYALFLAASLPLTGSFIREDGLTSIRRSYTAREMIAATPPGWRTTSHFPFHNLLIYSPGSGRV